ncbi:alpha-ketoglutarate-dependent dioxygenase AlkB [Lysobacter hankyongensis]|uniref:Alpha-ketoglutarate-dependent dioxygenase AlkB n=1 Tax=Lysobacter hankyongensis TaxID=1176535 RepID=A0ABP9ATB7_9GAMM
MPASPAFPDSQRIDLPGADLWFAPTWLARGEADALLSALLVDPGWEVHRIRMFGRTVDSPRLSRWIGDPGAVYTYSRTRFDPHPWPDALAGLRLRLREALGVDFNSVLANRYRDGRDRMGWHSDDEPELGPRPVIASISLGATRRFALKPRGEGRRVALDLPHGSLLVMAGATQSSYRHALPATARPVGERVNLTFRRILQVSASR